MTPVPFEHGWWLASRASGTIALLAITLSVGAGLAMAGKATRKPLFALHQHTALAGLIAIAVHGITLLGDSFLGATPADIAVPFLIEHERAYTGLGVVGGWLAAILGLTYYLRDRIGPKRWRSLHRATILVYVLSVIHTLGAGTDAQEPWLRVLVVATGAPVLFLLIVRVIPRDDGLRRLRVTRIIEESEDVRSFHLEPTDGKPVPPHAPGQFVTISLDGHSRSYSLSTAHGRRISVKRDGSFSRRLHELDTGAIVRASEPAGGFVLDETDKPVVLLSAGIGATPVLAMLHALAAASTSRPVHWIHAARDPEQHAFRTEVADLIAGLADGHLHVRYSRHDGRWTADEILERVPRDAAFHLCGPSAFVADLEAGLTERGVTTIASESFGGSRPTVAFTRSNKDVTWDPSFATLLDLAEAHDVPATSGCRAGACHACKVPVLSGKVRHDPQPAQPPPAGTALLCCARPAGDLALEA